MNFKTCNCNVSLKKNQASTGFEPTTVAMLYQPRYEAIQVENCMDMSMGNVESIFLEHSNDIVPATMMRSCVMCADVKRSHNSSRTHAGCGVK